MTTDWVLYLVKNGYLTKRAMTSSIGILKSSMIKLWFNFHFQLVATDTQIATISKVTADFHSSKTIAQKRVENVKQRTKMSQVSNSLQSLNFEYIQIFSKYHLYSPYDKSGFMMNQ